MFTKTHPTRSGKAPSNGIEIYYETFGKPENPSIFLIMGLDAQCTLWSMSFIEPLVEADYQVVRFDNRDIGLSTWINDWKKSQAYTLEDMAKDVVGLMDFLQISQVHIIGASMGGMIAQRLAISYPERVLTLTSIMSSAYTLNLQAQPSIVTKVQAFLIPFVLKNFEIKTKFTHFKVTVGNYLSIWRMLVGTRYPFNETYFKELFTYNILERKGQNPMARLHQFTAIIASGSRLKELGKIKAPTLVIHGTEDKLVPPIHAQIYAPLIPNAKLLWLEGVGHEIPQGVVYQIHSELKELFKKAV